MLLSEGLFIVHLCVNVAVVEEIHIDHLHLQEWDWQIQKKNKTINAMFQIYMFMCVGF